MRTSFIFIFAASLALGLTGCESKTECTSFDWQPGRANCQGTFSDCEDGRSRSVVCSPRDPTTSCDCRVDGSRRRTFSDEHICGRAGDDAFVGKINRSCGWELSVVEPEPEP